MRSVGQAAKTILQTRVMDAEQKRPAIAPADSAEKNQGIYESLPPVKTRRGRKKRTDQNIITTFPQGETGKPDHEISLLPSQATTINCDETKEVTQNLQKKFIVTEEDEYRSGSPDDTDTLPDARGTGMDAEETHQ